MTRALFCLALLAVLSPAPAWACGAFQLQDAALRRTFTFHANSVRFARGERPDTVLFRIGPDPGEGLTLEGEKAPLLVFRDAVLLLRGKPVGKLEGEVLTIGKRVYRVTVTPIAGEGRRRHAVDISERGAVVMQTRAVSFLACGAENTITEARLPPTAAEVEEVRMRLALFLAWRQLAVPDPLPAQ